MKQAFNEAIGLIRDRIDEHKRRLDATEKKLSEQREALAHIEAECAEYRGHILALQAALKVLE